MKLDRRHLVVSLMFLIGAVVYNVWVFTRPAATATVVTAESNPIAAPAQGLVVDRGTAPIDPTQPIELPDVVLDRLPQWPRDPFANLRRPEEPVLQAEVPLEPAPAPEPDPVIGSILYSSDRRLVTIDGRVARIGDTVGGVRIVDILPNAVVVESPLRGRRTLPVGAGVRR